VKGRVAVFHGPKTLFDIREFEVPDPEPGAVVVKISQAGVCGSDLHNLRGDNKNLGLSLPPNGCTTGHEGSGVVTRLGAGVTTDFAGKPIKEGDRVVWQPFPSCGHCYHCLGGRGNLCSQRGRDFQPIGEAPYFTGTYGDYYYVKPRQAFFRVPDELPDSVLGYVNCAMGTVTEGLIQAGCKQGDYVVIQGAGGLGLLATAVAKDMGAHRVIVLDRLPNRLALACEFGANATINVATDSTTPEQRKERVWDLTDGRGADIVIELVGRSELFLEGLDFLTAGGTFVEIGNIIPGNAVPFEPNAVLRGSKRIIGSAMYQPRLLPMMLETMVKKQDSVPFDRLVSHTFPLDQINEAFEQAEWLDRQTAVTRSMLVP
jgi:threonine dehydrogenase-like Zn-dependent dehydrogenase